jgi:hypothetical protein
MSRLAACGLFSIRVSGVRYDAEAIDTEDYPCGFGHRLRATIVAGI